MWIKLRYFLLFLLVYMYMYEQRSSSIAQSIVFYKMISKNTTLLHNKSAERLPLEKNIDNVVAILFNQSVHFELISKPPFLLFAN